MSIKTRVGVHLGDTYLFYGKKVESFRGQTQWSMLAQALGEGPISEADSRVLDDIFIALLSPDPRIWPVKTGRVVASYGDPYAGMACANNLLTDGVGGPSKTKSAAATLLKVHRANAQERVKLVWKLANEENKIFRVFYRNADERHLLLKEWTQKSPVSSRPFYRSMLALEKDVLDIAPKKSTSFTLSLASVLLDLGISVENTGHFAVLGVAPQIFANTLEAATQKSNEYLKLPLSLIDYVGPKPRRSSRSRRGAIGDGAKQLHRGGQSMPHEIFEGSSIDSKKM